MEVYPPVAKSYAIESRAALAAVAELIEAADKAANHLAAIGYPVDGQGRYTKGGTWNFADAVPRPVDADEVASAFRILSAALARCNGGAQ